MLVAIACVKSPGDGLDVLRCAWSNVLILTVQMLPNNAPLGLYMAPVLSQEIWVSRWTRGGTSFVCIDSGHGIRLNQLPELWLLWDSMGTFVGGVNPVALDLPIVCQVSVPLSGATFLLA